MLGIPIDFKRRYDLSREEIYGHIKKAFSSHWDVDGIYLLSPAAGASSMSLTRRTIFGCRLFTRWRPLHGRY